MGSELSEYLKHTRTILGGRARVQMRLCLTSVGVLN
jgi:hypothetical protein